MREPVSVSHCISRSTSKCHWLRRATSCVHSVTFRHVDPYVLVTNFRISGDFKATYFMFTVAWNWTTFILSLITSYDALQLSWGLASQSHRGIFLDNCIKRTSVQSYRLFGASSVGQLCSHYEHSICTKSWDCDYLTTNCTRTIPGAVLLDNKL